MTFVATYTAEFISSHSSGRLILFVHSNRSSKNNSVVVISLRCFLVSEL